MNLPNPRLLVCSALAAFTITCGAELEPAPGGAVDPATSSPGGVASTGESFVALAEFTGRFDAATGTLDLRTSAPEVPPAASSRQQSRMRTLSQPLYCEFMVALGPDDTVSLETVSDSMGVTPTQCGYSGFPYSVLGMLCVTIRVRSSFTTMLHDVFAEIVYVEPVDHSGYMSPLGNGADLSEFEDGPGKPTDLAGGAFYHGDLGPGVGRAAVWTFRNSGGGFFFRGRVVGRVPEFDNGVDDNCDGRVDDRLREYPEGAECLVDMDCVSGACREGDDAVYQCTAP